eukprot:scaffold103006_cov66-Phaeocystis_antarctica.AAC.3
MESDTRPPAAHERWARECEREHPRVEPHVLDAGLACAEVHSVVGEVQQRPRQRKPEEAGPMERRACEEGDGGGAMRVGEELEGSAAHRRPREDVERDAREEGELAREIRHALGRPVE